MVNVSSVVGNKVTKTVFEKKKNKKKTQQLLRTTRVVPRELLNTQSSELFDILVLKWSYKRREIIFVE